MRSIVACGSPLLLQTFATTSYWAPSQVRPRRVRHPQITGTKILLASTRPVREVGRPLRVRRALEASVIDILANSKIRLCSVKRMTQIQNTSQSIAATKYFRIAAREHTLAPPGRHRPRHSRMQLAARQNTPAIDAAIYRPNGTLYQLQPSFHTSSMEPEPTARARRAGKAPYR